MVLIDNRIFVVFRPQNIECQACRNATDKAWSRAEYAFYSGKSGVEAFLDYEHRYRSATEYSFSYIACARHEARELALA